MKNIFGLNENMIILDDMETWGGLLLDLLKKNRSTIFGYFDEEFNIDKQAEKDVMLRINRPKNRFQSDWQNVLSVFNESIKHSIVIGFHCTRLTDFEITSIQQDELDLLNKDRFIKRIKKLKEENLITKPIFEELLNNNNVDDSNRNGMLWFFHCISTLKDESGLYRLFRRWGGESLYCKHEGESGCNEVLQKIGIPCIVLGLLSSQDIESTKTLTERMINFWKESFTIDPTSRDIDTSVSKKVDVFKVISIQDPLFLELTEFSQWSKKIFLELIITNHCTRFLLRCAP